MALNIPTTQEIIDQNIASYEAKLNQTSPVIDKAFMKVLATIEGMGFTTLYKLAVERAKQNLVITATKDDLDKLGDEYGVKRKPAEAAKIEAELPGTNGTIIQSGTEFTSDSTGLRYTSDTTETIAGGIATLILTCIETGTAGNINNGETLSIVSQIPGADTTATVTKGADDPDVPNLGIDRELDQSYSRRISLEIQTVGGGGNGVDYRTWAEETPGCFRAFPYAGAPLFTIPTFKDGNMEDSGVSDWTPINNATLTKDLSAPHTGLKALKIEYNGTAYPGAVQFSLTEFVKYKISGWAKGDGVNIPIVTNSSVTAAMWIGVASSSWQYFEREFIAQAGGIAFVCSATATGFCEFDDIDITETSLPGDRTVFVEADATIDPDGIAPQSLLDDVRQYISYDPDTGKSRPTLGMTDETLIVESITRTVIFTEIRGLIVDASIEAETKTKIETAIDEYLRDITPYIEGTDPPATRRDTITDLTISRVVQDILDPVGGSASGVGFGIESGLFLSFYNLSMGELSKSGGVTYV